jgi:hypothetical protein
MCAAGLARVVDYLFTHDPNREQLRYMDISDEDGASTYGQLRRRLCGASALGYWSASENRTFLNPKDNAAVVPGDQMLVLSKRQPKFAPEAVVSGESLRADLKELLLHGRSSSTACLTNTLSKLVIQRVL